MANLMQHSTFQTTGSVGLRHDTLPMRLYHKAKKLGTWDPRSLDFTQDVLDWQRCSPEEQETLLTLTSLFQAGEESVTLDLLPLITAVAQQGQLEEEMFLTTFLFEEAKHTEFFRRFLDDVAGVKKDLHMYHSASYRKIFYEELPQTMSALLTDTSPAAQVRASVTYNMIVEGVLAETGYQAYFDMLERNQIMPGLKQGLTYVKRDESRHIAYGIFLISRLVLQQPDLWDMIEVRMNELLPYALGVIQEADSSLPAGEENRFGLRLTDYVGFAMDQFNKRMNKIAKARQQTFDQLFHEQDDLS
ncbi:R2-like ligand-binding oxidase [Dictyobacter aurantiacus]|uniref:R2-like ligand binding oxidase n=1 Tax=Dictyobacter aurantiacus TaxID=1936993 RepID=A0A401ZNX0_9CHLR|nr:R2-like ligand-binding oxidase [Dictyobacter aurantiacus]GCE08553.1 ribonucleotide-diphosphate reductase [Dictyobacter aurantiacus]